MPADRAHADMLRQGQTLLAGLDIGASTTSLLFTDPDSLDTLYASIELLDRNRQSASSRDLARISRLYDLAFAAGFSDELGEKDWILAQLAFLAWNQCRLAEDYPATKQWQARCCEHVLAQDHLAAFFEIPYRSRSAELNERYLGDETVLLAACDRLERDRNTKPVEVARDGASLYRWLANEGPGCGLESDFLRFISASVALWTCGSLYAVGHLEGWRRWYRRAEVAIEGCAGSAPLAAVLEHLRLSVLFWDCSYEDALQRIDRAIAEFERLRMAEGAVRGRYLKAVILKELEESCSALEVLSTVCREAIEMHDLFLASLSLADGAQILGTLGRSSEAISMARQALSRAEDSKTLWAIAYAQSTVGELLRDRGEFSLAAQAYASASRLYDEAGMNGLASYTRVLEAETLLLDGRPREAVSAILTAMPIIETHGLTQEGAVAAALLSESIHRQQADPVALRQLRQQLQEMRRQGKL